VSGKREKTEEGEMCKRKRNVSNSPRSIVSTSWRRFIPGHSFSKANLLLISPFRKTRDFARVKLYRPSLSLIVKEREGEIGSRQI